MPTVFHASVFQRSVIVWIGLSTLAVANGVFREAVIAPRLGAQGGHVLSTLILCFAIFAVTWFTLPWIEPRRGREALLVGALWLALTLAFEFLAGHYLFGHPWEKLLADYDIARGRVWPLVLVTTLLAPWITAVMRGMKGGGEREKRKKDEG
ncbi:MAG: hypothetical protein JXR72_01165 [Proteobacteria bacterium]|nr:hypothetical protein [Pseudomonadota bacterium]